MDHIMRRRQTDRSKGVLTPSSGLPQRTPSPIPFKGTTQNMSHDSFFGTSRQRSPSPLGANQMDGRLDGTLRSAALKHSMMINSLISTTNQAVASMSDEENLTQKKEMDETIYFFPTNPYKSKALEYEVKISEALYKKRVAPHPDRTSAVMDVFEEFVNDEVTIAFRRFLLTLYEELYLSIYSENYLTASTAADSKTPIVKSPFFLAVKRLEQEKQDLMVARMRLQNDLKEQEINYTNLVDEVTRLKEVISEKDQEIHNLHMKETKIRNELTKVRDQMIELKKDRERFETLWAADHHRVDTLKKELDDTTNEFSTQLEEMRELNVNQVPRHQYERSQNKLMRLTSDHTSLQEAHQDLTDRHNQLIAKMHDSAKIIHDYEKRAAITTPRPQIELYEALFPDRTDEEEDDDSEDQDYMFRAPYVAKSSRDKFSVLAKSVEVLRGEVRDLREKLAIASESSAKKIRSGKYFIGRGNGLHIPKYMRYVGRIPNHNMTRRELEGIISEILEHKDRHEKNTGHEEPLADYIYIFFQKKYGSQQAIAFCSYNMLDALKRYHHESDCRLFYRVLKGDYPFSLYASCTAELTKVRTIVREIARTENVKSMKKEVLARIKEDFPLKSEQDMNDLRDAMSRDKLFQSKQYEKMLREGPFIQEVKDQFLYSFEEYVTGLGEILSTLDRRKTGRLTLREVGEGLRQFDPDKSIKELRNYLAAGSGTNIRDMDPSSIIEISTFLKRLSRLLPCRRSLPNEKPAAE